MERNEIQALIMNYLKGYEYKTSKTFVDPRCPIYYADISGFSDETYIPRRVTNWLNERNLPGACNFEVDVHPSFVDGIGVAVVMWFNGEYFDSTVFFIAIGSIYDGPLHIRNYVPLY